MYLGSVLKKLSGGRNQERDGTELTKYESLKFTKHQYCYSKDDFKGALNVMVSYY